MSRRLAPLLLLVLVSCGQEAAGIGQRASAVARSPGTGRCGRRPTTGDRAARRELAELRQTVADLRQQGELSEAGAARVLAAAAEVEARLSSLATPAVPTTQVTPTTPRPTTGPTGPTPTKKPKGNDDNGGNDDDDD